MIIKNKPFHIPACQAIACAYYFPAGVIGCSVIPFGWCCDIANVRRWPGFPQLEAYQVRLSRYLVMRRSDAVFDRRCDAHFDRQLEDYLEAGRAGGVL
ncbi:hypothetical protein HF292_008020 [Acidithiobacillus ferruginosus]|uniref:Uncharacterized protein n=1 Tax=Acidithiobacillus ferruginosus TaxID=3063951 RepID=A0ACD5IDS5_9PROT|nr:hypothetical protein [Acidithiobacillus ferruginosus]MBU2813266.1 hypothetical protein [Acidithiobacillus ferruginosus]